MAQIPCQHQPVVCPPGFGRGIDPSFPVTNYSSEAPDEDVFIGRNTGFWPSRPPLGGTWYSAGCLGTATSTVSQEDADRLAANSWVECIGVQWPNIPNTPPGGDSGPPPGDQSYHWPTPSSTPFGNSEQTCSSECPDGIEFNYTVEAGLYTALTQEQADLIAASFACHGAVASKICLSELSSVIVCKGGDYSGEITITEGAEASIVSVTENNLPSGVTATLPDSQTLVIQGVPTDSGDFNFTVTAEDGDGNFMEKSYFISVIEILNGSPLPSGEKGTAYLEILSTGAGGVSVAWSIVSGSLPSGLTLFPEDGTLSGVPEEVGEFSFRARVTVTDDETEQTVSCEKDFTLTIIDPVFNEMTWAVNVFTETGEGSASWTGSGGAFSASASATPNPGVGNVQITGSLNHTGTGSVIPASVTATITESAFGNSNAGFTVSVDGGVVGGSSTPGDHTVNFNIPAANSIISIVVFANAAPVVTFGSSASITGSASID